MIIAIKCYALGKSNKLKGWIATWKEEISYLPQSMKYLFYGCTYEYDKKLDTLMRNFKDSPVVLSCPGICQQLNTKVNINVFHYIY